MLVVVVSVMMTSMANGVEPQGLVHNRETECSLAFLSFQDLSFPYGVVQLCFTMEANFIRRQQVGTIFFVLCLECLGQ